MRPLPVFLLALFAALTLFASCGNDPPLTSLDGGPTSDAASETGSDAASD